MLRIAYNSVTDVTVTPFSFFGWFNKDDGRYLFQMTITDKATKTIEQLIFIKTADIITVYRRYDETTAIFQCHLHENGISHHALRSPRSNAGDGDVRFVINRWTSQG